MKWKREWLVVSILLVLAIVSVTGVNAQNACTSASGHCEYTTDPLAIVCDGFVVSTDPAQNGACFAAPPEMGTCCLPTQPEPPQCTNGESRSCGSGVGVCSGATQTCSNGVWSACNYGPNYVSSENECSPAEEDGADNDCDGTTDECQPLGETAAYCWQPDPSIGTCGWTSSNPQYGWDSCCGPPGNVVDCTKGGTDPSPPGWWCRAESIANGGNYCSNFGQTFSCTANTPPPGNSGSGLCDDLSVGSVDFEYFDAFNPQTAVGHYSWCFPSACPSGWSDYTSTGDCTGLGITAGHNTCCAITDFDPSSGVTTPPPTSGGADYPDPASNCCGDATDSNFCKADKSCNPGTESASDCNTQAACDVENQIVCLDLEDGTCVDAVYPAQCADQDELAEIPNTVGKAKEDVPECFQGCCFFEGDTGSASGGNAVTPLECVRNCEEDNSCEFENNFPVWAENRPPTANTCDADWLTENSQCCVIFDKNLEEQDLQAGVSTITLNPAPEETDVALLFANIQSEVISVTQGSNTWTPVIPSSTFTLSGSTISISMQSATTLYYFSAAGAMQEVSADDWLGCRAQTTQASPCFLSATNACGTAAENFGFTPAEIVAADCPYTDANPPPPPPGPEDSVSVTVTVPADLKESDIRTKTTTITLELDGAEWVDTSSFPGIRDDIIAGLDADPDTEENGWEDNVKPAIGVGAVVRTSATKVTITVPVVSSYDIENQEAIQVRIPIAATDHDDEIIATDRFIILTDDEEPNERRVQLSGSVTEQIKESAIRAREHKLVITLINAKFIETGFQSFSSFIIEGITNHDQDNVQQDGWNKNVRDKIPEDISGVRRTSDNTVEITIPRNTDYSITTNEGITVTVPEEVILDYDQDLAAQDTITVFDEDEVPPDPCDGNTQCGECDNPACPSGPVCPNNICETGESTSSCPADCDPGPGDPVCGDGTCNGDETSNSCPVDCGPSGGFCGDDDCNVEENHNNCPADCEEPFPGSCGNGVCESHEDHDTCSADCPGSGCTDDDDCPGTQVCSPSGQCEAGSQCSDDDDCAAGESCSPAGECVANDTTPPTATIEIS